MKSRTLTSVTMAVITCTVALAYSPSPSIGQCNYACVYADPNPCGGFGVLCPGKCGVSCNVGVMPTGNKLVVYASGGVAKDTLGKLDCTTSDYCNSATDLGKDCVNGTCQRGLAVDHCTFCSSGAGVTNQVDLAVCTGDPCVG